MGNDVSYTDGKDGMAEGGVLDGDQRKVKGEGVNKQEIEKNIADDQMGLI